MKLATYTMLGHQHVGLVSADGLSVQALALSKQEHALGVLALVDRQASGLAFPEIQADVVALDQIKLLAPVPHNMNNTCSFTSPVRQ